MTRSILGAAFLAALWPSAVHAQSTHPAEDRQFAFRMEGSFSAPLGAPVVLDSSGDLSSDQVSFPFDGRTGGNLRLGFDIPGGFTPMIGLGLGVASTSESTTTTTNDQFKSDRTVYSAVLSLQARYYTARHGAGLAPFVWLEFDKTFLWGTAKATGPNVDSKAAQKQLDDTLRGVNPLGLLAGFGAEYGFARSFAVGGRFGLGWFWVHRKEDPASLDPTVSAESSSASTVASQAELYAAFRF